MKIRSITIFANLTLPLSDAQLEGLGNFAASARNAYTKAGFEVQTVRLATDLFPALALSSWSEAPAEFVVALETQARAHGFDYISLGPSTHQMLPHLPDIFAATKYTFATAHIINSTSSFIDGDVIRNAAQIIQKISKLEDGFGNLRFAALANVPPGSPFFPAAYHDGSEPTFAIATQSADLAVRACEGARDVGDASARLITEIEHKAARLVSVAAQLAQDYGIYFDGIDFSLAPYPTPQESIGSALEALIGQPLGASGTLAAVATLADALERAEFPHIGFCGVMLPVLEDTLLAQRAAEGCLSIASLLQWSAVCGTGLDTIPLPGDVSEGALVRLLFDVAALSLRLNKPLTARLMPLPGKVAGDAVHFDFPYFADGGVLALNGADVNSLFVQTMALKLNTRKC